MLIWLSNIEYISFILVILEHLKTFKFKVLVRELTENARELTEMARELTES